MTVAVQDNQNSYPVSKNYFDERYPKPVIDASVKHIYYQLFIKVVLSLIELFLFIVVIRSISSDISEEIKKNHEKESAERLKCKQDYEANFCDQKELPLALKGLCESWKVCSETAPSGVAKTKAAARVLAQIINELVDPLSPKAITVFVMIIIAWIIITKGNS